jgi:hypothetical protein
MLKKKNNIVCEMPYFTRWGCGMEQEAIGIAFAHGENLVNVLGRIFVLVGIESHRRPRNSLFLMDPHSGKRRTCSPDQVESVLGRIDIAKLPFKVRVLGPLAWNGHIQAPLILPDGSEVRPGEKVWLWNHVLVVYQGVNPRNRINPIIYRTEDGQTRTGPRAMFVAWAREG